MEQTPLLFIFLFLLLNSFPTHSQKPPIAPTQPPSSSPKAPSSSPKSPSPSSSPKPPSSPSPSSSPKPPSPSSSPKTPSSPSPTSSSSSPSPSSSPSSSSTLDPKQIKALQSLDIPTKKDPCSAPPSLHHAIQCDNSKPFRNVVSLHLINCSDDVSFSSTALKSLSTLKDLQFINCPVSPASFPSELSSNLKSFTCINCMKKLSGVWLSHFENVTDLTVTDVPIRASGPVIILGQLEKVTKVTLSNTNLTGELPAKSWNANVSHIDLSDNRLEGKIPSLMTQLENLVSLNLSSNQLDDVLPTSIGDLIELKNLSLSSNSLSGSIPKSIASIPSLVNLDLSSNQFNGSIPKFLGEMKSLKYLNLEKNNFQGVMPFNASFIKKLQVFKIGDNTNLCYNHTTISSKLKLGIAKCDKDGFPIAAPAPKEDFDYEEDGDSSEESTAQKSGGSHGPNKVVLGVAIALSSIVFLIIFLVLLSRKCT